MSEKRTIAHIQVNSLLENTDQAGFFVYKDDEWVSHSKGETYERMRMIGMGLWSLGVRHSDRVAVMSESRYEWALVDMGGLTIGATVVSIYPTSTAEATGYILQHSGSTVAILENKSHWDKIADQRDTFPDLEHIVMIDPTGMPQGATEAWISLDRLEALGRSKLGEQPDLPETALAVVQADDLASLMYTSGTTGKPKGVALTHDMLFTVVDVVANARATDEEEPEPEGDPANSVIYLPMSHILQRMIVYGVVYAGGVMYFAPSINDLVMTCQAANPISISGVPRVYEKIQARILAGVAQRSAAEQTAFHQALEVGRAVVHKEMAGEPVPAELAQQYATFDQLVFQPLRQRLFGSNIEYASCGAAPISRDLLEFFHIIGVPILEGYGLTETCAPITLNLPHNYKIGTVGPALPGSEIKIAEDGEILLKGPSVFEHYYNNPHATQDAFTEDGWFRSGDIGRLDEDGFLTITDRKKHLIITAAGKNIAPAPIEMQLNQHPLIAQVVVHGDRRKYLSALLTLDGESVAAWREQQGKSDLSPAEVAKDPQITTEIATFIETVNQNLAQYETIKRFEILPEEFTVENGFLTSSMKLKRKTIEQVFGTVLDGMYR